MKTSIIKNGILFSNKDYQNLKKGDPKILNKLLYRCIIDDTENNKDVSKVLEDLNNTDGGGPMVILKGVEANFIQNHLYGKINFAYELKLEWGCSAIKKEFIKHEVFDFEVDDENKKVFLYLFIPA
jgi:hypothetical protein